MQEKKIGQFVYESSQGSMRVYRLTCSKCEEFQRFSVRTTGLDERDEKFLIQRAHKNHWSVTATRVQCPQHFKSSKAYHAQTKAEEPMVARQDVTKPDKINGAAKPAEPKANGVHVEIADVIRIISAIEPHYARGRGYAVGWDDKRIAGELGVSEQSVEQTRKAKYPGDLDPQEMRAFLEEARTMHGSLMKISEQTMDAANRIEARLIGVLEGMAPT